MVKPTFFRSHRSLPRLGSSAVEYAVMLGLVTAVIIGALFFLGSSTEKTFAKLNLSTLNESEDLFVEKNRILAKKFVLDTALTEPVFHQTLFFNQILALFAVTCLLVALRKNRKIKEETENLLHKKPLRAFKEQKQLFKKRQQIYKLLAGDMPALISNNVTVGHLMSRNLKSVSLNTPANKIRKEMTSHQMRHMLVCNTKNQLIGIISDRDLHNHKAHIAAELMTPDPITVTGDHLIAPAITQMMDRRISCLPIVNDVDQPLGVLTSTDLMMALQCSLQLLHSLAIELKQPEDVFNKKSSTEAS